MIASDDSNPNFVGAHDPDARLSCRFYIQAIQNEFESKKQERPIFYEAEMVQIKLPGNQLNDFVGFVNDTHKQRFPKQWAIFQNNRNSDTSQIGTPLEQWPLVSKSVCEELRGAKFYTVESIANASDQQLQSIGMRAGMQPHTFREKAQHWLKRADSDAAAAADAERIRVMEEEKQQTARAMAEMQAQIAELVANQRIKPGPKPKVEQEA